jgi:hypothetical protein
MFLWMDAANSCSPSKPMEPAHFGTFNSHFDRFFASYFHYEVRVSTFNPDTFNRVTSFDTRHGSGHFMRLFQSENYYF